MNGERSGDVQEGLLPGDLPYLRVGSGPPLLMALGLTPEHRNPTGVQRRIVLGLARPFAQHFSVYLVNRRVGLARGVTMADIAADHARAIREEFGGPVAVHGTSTGGSVALQLAVDHPDLVRRLVVASAAHRLGDHGLEVQSRLGRRTADGDVRGAWAGTTASAVPPAVRPLAWGLGWLTAPLMAPSDPGELLATVEAEDVFDVADRLGEITAPTLVVGGSADPYYSEELFRRTAEGIPHGRVVVLRGKGHTYASVSREAVGLALGFLLAD